MTDPRTEQRLAAAMALAAEVDAAGSSDAMRGPVFTLGHEWRDFARRTMAADPALFAASDEALREDGQALADMPDYWTVEKLEGSGWTIRDQHGFVRNPDEVGYDNPSTFAAAIAAALGAEGTA